MEKLENFTRARRMFVFFPQPPKDSVKKHFAGKQFGTSFRSFEKCGALEENTPVSFLSATSRNASARATWTTWQFVHSQHRMNES